MKRIEAEKLATADEQLKSGYDRRMKNEELTSEILTKLTALAVAGSELEKVALFASLWTNLRSFEKHLEKRIQLKDINDAEEYADFTFSLLSKAETAFLVDGEYIELVMDDGLWSIIINRDGRIKTSYARDDDAETFIDYYHRRGRKVYVTSISTEIRQIIKELFGSR
ncbi:MAG: hypothetical protein HQL49_13570 [Gammaproteobacteria bacterium]|nr:hypothetical protein [Gammaproteobacteria bacterium]